jgi:hypothetical protein
VASKRDGRDHDDHGEERQREVRAELPDGKTELGVAEQPDGVRHDAAQTAGPAHQDGILKHSSRRDRENGEYG